MSKYIEDNSIPEPNTGCWLWLKALSGKYGVAKHYYLAHRYSYTQYKGVIPEGLNILHSCDQPSCVNPEHLFAGTQKKNVIDTFKRGRKGSLTLLDVQQIKNIVGWHHKDIANIYKVSRSTISRAINSTTWNFPP